MKLQFTHQAYQTQAVNAVVQLFDGQPLAKSEFALVSQNSSVRYGADGSIGNQLQIDDGQILSNVQRVQQANGLIPSTVLEVSKSDNGKETFCLLNFTIEMETGTGKTYTFIKTIYALNKQYGFKKFVIVVPSVAIREGTLQNLRDTHEHFAADYARVPCEAILYNSDKLNELKHFAQSDALSILVITIDSFTKDSNKINQLGERACAPIEHIRAVQPIVIVDEPQNFETDIRRKALFDLNPLCTLRYSATHRNLYNLLYKLDPVQAYDLGLVKQIEVDGILADHSQNMAFVELVDIEAKAKRMTAKISLDVNDKTEVKRKTLPLKLGDDLYVKSNQRAYYQAGFILNEIRSDEVVFSGGLVLKLHHAHGGLMDEVMSFQIERTVATHFAKLERLKPQGIKVLSLFFIDKVASYRSVDDSSEAVAGKFAIWFTAAFEKYAKRYPDLIPYDVKTVHGGYFSGDKKGKGGGANTVWVDSTERGSSKDDDTYELIMQERKRLLSLDEPLQFIFSHTALREGWDNPNVFQICTLNESKSLLKKRQELGRGLRLPVNQQGERVHDKQVNILTVIPNESYASFATALQQELEEDAGVKFAGRVKDARAKVRISRKPLSAEEHALFTAIWNKINYQTRYSVKLDTTELMQSCIAALQDFNQYPKVQAPKVRSKKAKLVLDNKGVQSVVNAVSEQAVSYQSAVVPDVYAYLQNRVPVSRESLFAILKGAGRLGELLINGQGFLDTVVRAITTCLQGLLVQGIKYHEINGKRYEMTLFDEPIETYLSSVYPSNNNATTLPLSKTLLQAEPILDNGDLGEAFACVVKDSDVESGFAQDCVLDERVKFFFKLPAAFKIPTPLGNYNPDWALVFENDTRVYFIVETKSELEEAKRRRDENLKIKCGEAHFTLNQEVVYQVTKDVQGLQAELLFEGIQGCIPTL
ncbi:DEAD-like helicases superfamily protein [Candidatus Nitrosoglobus terrae]|uniref:DEAD-like helicases superfamily protein n=1 Tax=Candidatus Nitrosoglobus terrae TaxID=1630141 RepID=A0A1Q2SPM9_9GAMM|nr:DEAD/DEAH box helicase family protein [Candidatus Nitrosoglobus terrae]BAW81057.1 DEAD-like helicases superfamily protein [Candidatus Nitrosoglobus terrae]